MYFTNLASPLEIASITEVELSEFPYFMWIYLGNLDMSEQRQTQLRVHLRRLKDYLIVILDDQDLEGIRSDSPVRDFFGSFESQKAHIGVVLLDNVDSRTSKLKTKIQPISGDSDAAQSILSEVDKLVRIYVPALDTTSILSKVTFERLFLVVKAMGKIAGGTL